MYKKILVLIILVLFLTACAHRVDDAVLRDTLFSVEQTRNGYYRIWMTHDDICGYCTNDQELGTYAINLLKEHDGEVLVYFRDIKRLRDPEYSWWDNSDCGSIYNGDSSTKMFYFDKIEPVNSR